MTRRYRQVARAAATAATRQNILQAALDLQGERLISQISLSDIAARADVSVQTVLRCFRSRASLFEATVTYASKRISGRRPTPAGDTEDAITALVDDHEHQGDRVLVMFAQAATHAHLRQMCEVDNVRHRGWVEDVFTPLLVDVAPAQRKELLDLLAIATDVHVWHMLRRDRGLSREQTQHCIEALVSAILSSSPPRMRPSRAAAGQDGTQSTPPSEAW